MKKLTIILGLIIILLISGCAKKEIIDSKEDLDNESYVIKFDGNRCAYMPVLKEDIPLINESTDCLLDWEKPLDKPNISCDSSPSMTGISFIDRLYKNRKEAEKDKDYLQLEHPENDYEVIKQTKEGLYIVRNVKTQEILTDYDVIIVPQCEYDLKTLGFNLRKRKINMSLLNDSSIEFTLKNSSCLKEGGYMTRDCAKSLSKYEFKDTSFDYTFLNRFTSSTGVHGSNDGWWLENCSGNLCDKIYVGWREYNRAGSKLFEGYCLDHEQIKIYSDYKYTKTFGWIHNKTIKINMSCLEFVNMNGGDLYDSQIKSTKVSVDGNDSWY
tara:strand:+ start:38 stop:1015 length:978 start_codon:yes stop_codon:yes gene_type:complete